MDDLTRPQALALARIFAPLVCADTLAMHCSWEWPNHDWQNLVDTERRRLASEGGSR